MPWEDRGGRRPGGGPQDRPQVGGQGRGGPDLSEGTGLGSSSLWSAPCAPVPVHPRPSGQLLRITHPPLTARMDVGRSVLRALDLLRSFLPVPVQPPWSSRRTADDRRTALATDANH